MNLFLMVVRLWLIKMEKLYMAPQFEETFTLDVELDVKDIISESNLYLNDKNVELEPLVSTKELDKIESMYAALDGSI